MKLLMILTVTGFTLDFLGKVLISYTAILVHHRFWKEHKIDNKVFAEMKREQKLGLVGVGLLLAGYLLQLPSKFGLH